MSNKKEVWGLKDASMTHGTRASWCTRAVMDASSLSTRLKLMVLFKVTASKLSLPKVETMRKSYYLNDNIFD